MLSVSKVMYERIRAGMRRKLSEESACHTNISLIPRIYRKDLVTVAQTCNLSTEEVEVDGASFLSSLAYLESLRPILDLVSKNTVEGS